MFTGIIETLGVIKKIHNKGSNVDFVVESSLAAELKIDQSLAHNGVCLTIVALSDNEHTVTAIDETLVRSNLGNLKVGSLVNLERAMLASARLDGHIVQGHVDTTAICIRAETLEGSWVFSFEYKKNPDYILVDKGSVCVNGVSLTVVSPTDNTFSVAIIPYTFEHTHFKNLNVGDAVNIEFDILGKYLVSYLNRINAAKLIQ
jgi:riboflavin synthase